jgi:hypothetical protein
LLFEAPSEAFGKGRFWEFWRTLPFQEETSTDAHQLLKDF